MKGPLVLFSVLVLFCFSILEAFIVGTPRKHVHPRDFHDELKPMTECQHPGYRPADTDVWRENMQDHSVTSKVLDDADGTINKLELDKNKAAFQADSLILARDAAQCAALYQKTLQSERSARLAKVMHLKQENSVGATIVAKHMEKECKHVSGPMSYIGPAMDQECLKLGCDSLHVFKKEYRSVKNRSSVQGRSIRTPKIENF